MARALGVSLEDILNEEPIVPARKSEPVGKLQRVFEQASTLPRRQQQKVVEIVTALLHEYQRKAS